MTLTLLSVLKCYISIHKKNNEFDLFNFRGKGIGEVMSVHKHHALRAQGRAQVI